MHKAMEDFIIEIYCEKEKKKIESDRYIQGIIAKN